MRASWYDTKGEAADEVLVCGELPTPNAATGEVVRGSGGFPASISLEPSRGVARRMEYQESSSQRRCGSSDQVGAGGINTRLGKRAGSTMGSVVTAVDGRNAAGIHRNALRRPVTECLITCHFAEGAQNWCRR